MTSSLLVDKLAGKFLTFDGLDGCGKTTQLRMMRDRLTAAGAQVVCASDPGGTEIGNRIRETLLAYDLSAMDVRCETFLFMASRAQLVSEVIEPAMADGATVLCSRFISATYAYQGAAGYGLARLLELGNAAVGDTWPDATIVLDVPTDVGFKRTRRKPQQAGKNRRRYAGQPALFDGATTDAMEARPIEYHRRVREIFRDLPGMYPRPVHVVDADAPPEEVHARIVELMERVDI